MSKPAIVYLNSAIIFLLGIMSFLSVFRVPDDFNGFQLLFIGFIYGILLFTCCYLNIKKPNSRWVMVVTVVIAFFAIGARLGLGALIAIVLGILFILQAKTLKKTKPVVVSANPSITETPTTPQ